MKLRSRLFLGISALCFVSSLTLVWLSYNLMTRDVETLLIKTEEITREVPALLPPVPIEKKALSRYETVLVKPLFSPSRRLEEDPPPPPKIVAKPKVVQPIQKAKPKPVKKAPPPPPPKELLLSLVGVVVLNGTPQALLKSETDGEFLRLAKGQSHNDWEVKEIMDDSVEFSHGELTKLLVFDKPQ
ncbi:hypothetical protein WH96_20580 [Kiloniella spongiae]|uniref:Type II secretion system protein GspC N-terminal domain-containing protein n=1 Tax=Kiloniella spongiae TaxID=1489064 RepID=A0A0H2M9N7_9PROT|nr:hypothetical protein [Kiloniella spongiae]KLN58881.1 hypothetical protein WH96_20580 [Kiloniella spongiae]